MCLTKQQKAYEPKAYFINPVQTQVTAISSIALRKLQSFSPSPQKPVENYTDSVHFCPLIESSCSAFYTLPWRKGRGINSKKSMEKSWEKKRWPRIVFPLQTVRLAFEILCLQWLYKLQTVRECEELKGEQRRFHVTNIASKQHCLHRCFLSTSWDCETLMQHTKYMNILTSKVKRELEKRGYGQRSVMLGLAKSAGLALPLILKHSDTLTLKEINLVCMQCQVNWNKNQNHWALKKKNLTSWCLHHRRVWYCSSIHLHQHTHPLTSLQSHEQWKILHNKEMQK